MDVCIAAVSSLASEAFRNFLLMSGVFTAVVSVLKVQATAKKKQTADLLFGCRVDDQLTMGNERVAAMHDAAGSIKNLLHADQASSPDAKAVKYVLNHWERVAVGILEGIYHEEMLRQSNRSNVVSLYQKAKPYIEGVRLLTSNPCFFQHFERMAISWEKRPLKPLKSWRTFR